MVVSILSSRCESKSTLNSWIDTDHLPFELRNSRGPGTEKIISYYSFGSFLHTATAAFLNGKSVQRNDITKRKTALGDIKNYAPMTPGIGCDKKSANSLNVDQLNLLADIDMLTTTPPTNPSDRCSSKPIDFERVWAERLLLSDAEVGCILPKGYYIDDRDLLPPPPPPSSLHDMDSE